MKNISIFLATALLAACSSTGMSSGSSMGGTGEAGYDAQSSNTIQSNPATSSAYADPSDVYFGD